MNKIDIGGFPINFSSANHNGSNFVDLTIIGSKGKFLPTRFGRAPTRATHRQFDPRYRADLDLALYR